MATICPDESYRPSRGQVGMMIWAGFLFLILLLIPSNGRAGDPKTYMEIQDWSPYYGGETGKTYIATSYEYSSISLGSRKLEWNVLSVNISQPGDKAIPYIEITDYDRDGTRDYTLAAGSYFKSKNAVLQVEAGFGMDVDFIYRFQTTVEYQHRLYKGLYGKIRGKYLNYTADDVGIVSPVGFIYYFGDNYLMADYSFSMTEGRGMAHWGSFKAHIALNTRLYYYAGLAVGQRLFDMNEISANKEEGYILFSGLEHRILENMQITVGCSYSKEKPNFTKRSIDVALSIKF